MKLLRLTAKNNVLFKSIELNLDSGQVLVVRGQNRCSETGDSNACGKSLLVSLIADVLYPANPVAIKKSASRWAEPSETSLLLESSGHEYLITRINKGGTVRYQIMRDGCDEQVRTVALMKEHIAKIWPITPEEYSSIWMLNSQHFHVLQRGTSTQRMEFFTKFFDLDYYDVMRKHFRTSLKAISDLEIERSVCESQLLTLQTEAAGITCPDGNLEDVRAQHKELTEKLDKLERRHAVLASQKVILSQRDMLIDGITHVSEDDVVCALQEVDTRITAFRRAETHALQRKRCLDKIEDLVAQRDKLVSEVFELEDNQIHEDIKGIRKYVQEYVSPVGAIQNNVMHVRMELRDVAAKRVRNDQVRAEMRDVLMKFPNVDTIDIGVAKQRSSQNRVIIDTYKRLREATDGCPVCGSKIDLEDLHKKAVDANAQLREDTAAIEYAELQTQLSGDVCDQETRLQEKLRSLETELSEANTFHTLITTLSPKLDQLYDVAAQLRKAKVDLSELPEAPKVIENIEELAALREVLGAELKTHRLMASLSNDFADISRAPLMDIRTSDVVTKLGDVTDALRAVRDDIQECGVLKTHLEVWHARNDQLTSQISTLADRIASITDKTSDKPVLESLVRAFSSKGIKVSRVRAIADIIINNLNRYRSLLFAEPFEFVHNVTETSFDIVVNRGAASSDVRTLSKSEGDRFCLLMMLSLLPLTRNRVNTVMMDEIDSGFSDVNRRMFREQFIPKLHTLVPNIVVVTPDDVPYPNTVDVKVVKGTDGISKLQCHVSNIVKNS